MLLNTGSVSRGTLARGVKSFSNVERSMSKCERNRETESAQPSPQVEKEKILSEQRSLRDCFERKTERAFQGKFAAQTRLSEAHSDLDRREWERRVAGIALYEIGRQLVSQRMELYQANQLIDQAQREKS